MASFLLPIHLASSLSLSLSLTATYEFPAATPFNILPKLPLGSREGGHCHCGIINAFKCLPASLCACLFMCACVCVRVCVWAVSAFCCRKLNKAAALPASKVALKRKHQQHRLLAAAWVNKNKKNMHGSVRAALEPWAWVGAKCKLQSAAHRTLLIQLNPHPAAN